MYQTVFWQKQCFACIYSGCKQCLRHFLRPDGVWHHFSRLQKSIRRDQAGLDPAARTPLSQPGWDPECGDRVAESAHAHSRYSSPVCRYRSHVVSKCVFLDVRHWNPDSTAPDSEKQKRAFCTLYIVSVKMCITQSVSCLTRSPCFLGPRGLHSPGSPGAAANRRRRRRQRRRAAA